MIDRFLLILSLSLLFIACKNKEEVPVKSTEDNLYKKTESNEIIRLISTEKLEPLNDSLKKFYELFQNYEIWHNNNTRKDLINEIKFCYNDGLNPADYGFEELNLLEKKRLKMSDEEIINYDILLTKNFEKLSKHLHSGKLDPKQLYLDWDLPKKEIALSKKLESGIKENKIASLFKEIKPKNNIYITIKKSLLLLEKYPNYSFGKLKIKNKIVVNDSTDIVVDIKKRLSYWNDYKMRDSIISPIYDSLTYLAVKKFQKRHNLKPDGVIGTGTIKALNYSKNERREQIIANLERWKWFPDDFGEMYLIANLPEFKISYVLNNDTITTERIVIGKNSRKTPILTSRLSNFVFNPTWTVPPTILKEDLTPAATKNRNYFEKNRITIYNTKGQPINPENWSTEQAKSYRYVQTPGINNSLGLVKFNFTNRHSVYLHDTNHRDYFSLENRALSSGCVRVENPLRLSKKILKDIDENWDIEEIDKIITTQKSKAIPIKKPVNVFLLYWTNWSIKNELYFCDDIYNLDKELFTSLRN
jgi:murein L,D-transpeptidase YcbB/YkuD